MPSEGDHHALYGIIKDETRRQGDKETRRQGGEGDLYGQKRDRPTTHVPHRESYTVVSRQRGITPDDWRLLHLGRLHWIAEG